MIIEKMKIVCNNPDCNPPYPFSKPFTMESSKREDIDAWKELIPKKALSCPFCQKPMELAAMNGRGGACSSPPIFNMEEI